MFVLLEYGHGGSVSTSGDVYSFGIVLMEMITGRRPTDPMFNDGLDIISFVESNTPHQMHQVVDANLKEECKDQAQGNTQYESPVYQCLAGLLQVALSSTHPLPSQRLNMKEIASRMQAIKSSYLGSKTGKDGSLV
jgi:serine/threonine protein kinase